MAAKDGHLDPEPGERKGWFMKGAPNPKRPYQKQCTDGYNGPAGKGYQNAHHVLPMESINDSTMQCSDSDPMLRAVQWITDWNLNNSGNMLGLPTFNAYFHYFHDEEIGYKALKKLASWAKVSFPMIDFAPAIFKERSPEGYVIHTPRSWGHVEYSRAVTKDLLDVWKTLSKNSQDHPEVAGNFAGQLNALQQKYKSKLIARGGNANRAAWERRVADPNWHVPFTMWDVQVNPLF